MHLNYLLFSCSLQFTCNLPDIQPEKKSNNKRRCFRRLSLYASKFFIELVRLNTLKFIIINFRSFVKINTQIYKFFNFLYSLFLEPNFILNYFRYIHNAAES